MENKLKDIFKKTIDNEIKIKYNDNYINNLDAINQYFLNSIGKGSKQPIALDSLIEYFYSKYPQLKKQLQLTKFVNSLINVGFNSNLIKDRISTDIIPIYGVELKTLLDLFNKTKDMSFLEEIIDSGKHRIRVGIDRPSNYEKFILSLIKSSNKSKKLLNNETYINIIKKIIDDVGGDFNIYKNFILGNLPPQIKQIIKEKIDELSFLGQFDLWNKFGQEKYNENVISFFNKINSKNYIPVGTPHGNEGLFMIKNKTEKLYGYANPKGDIIIPPMFDEISSSLKPIIMGKVEKDRGDIKAGYYKMNSKGEVLEHFEN